MSNNISWCVIDGDGNNLFRINYVPPLGSTLHYYVDWGMVGDLSQYVEHLVEHWESIDKKYWRVKDVYCEIRNYSQRGEIDEVPVYFVEVEEISPPDSSEQ